MFVAQTLEDPLRRVPLLPRPFAILFQDLIDDPYKRVQLRLRWQPACEDEWRDRVANAETSGSSGACSASGALFSVYSSRATIRPALIAARNSLQSRSVWSGIGERKLL